MNAKRSLQLAQRASRKMEAEIRRIHPETITPVAFLAIKRMIVASCRVNRRALRKMELTLGGQADLWQTIQDLRQRIDALDRRLHG